MLNDWDFLTFTANYITIKCKLCAEENTCQRHTVNTSSHDSARCSNAYAFV